MNDEYVHFQMYTCSFACGTHKSMLTLSPKHVYRDYVFHTFHNCACVDTPPTDGLLDLIFAEECVSVGLASGKSMHTHVGVY